MLVRRLNERRLAEANKEGQKTERKRWKDWYERLPQEIRDQQPPPPVPPQDEEP